MVKNNYYYATKIPAPNQTGKHYKTSRATSSQDNACPHEAGTSTLSIDTIAGKFQHTCPHEAGTPQKIWMTRSGTVSTRVPA